MVEESKIKLNALQLGVVLGIINSIFKILIYYGSSNLWFYINLSLYVVGFISLIWYVRKNAFLRQSFKSLFVFYSKIFQLCFIITFIFDVFIFNFIDPELKVQLANSKVIERKEKFENMENEKKIKFENLEVELDKIYEEEVAKKSLFGLFSNLLATMLFYFIVTLLLSFYQKNVYQ